MQPWFIILTQPYITKQGYWMPKEIPINENLPYKTYQIHFIFTYGDEPHRLSFIIEILMILESYNDRI